MNPWDTVLHESIELRRELHQQPELGWHEEHSAALIRRRLDDLQIPWRQCTATGTVARLAPQARGKHIALRADIDALPVTEAAAIAWKSRNEGCMHACGHDGHTATLLATAAWLKRQESKLPGPVTLLFQPAEEGGHGAREMIREGALEEVQEIYGWHNWPAIANGQALCPDGPVMAGNGTFEIVVRGQGGHASQPEACRDPVLAAAAIVLALQQIISRRISAKDSAVLSVTSLDGKSGLTVIPESVTLGGSMRITETATREAIGNLITQIAEDTARAYGVTAKTRLTPRYNPTCNHSPQAEQLRAAVATEYGDDWECQQVRAPVMASEDFSYYLEQIPGAYALIGAREGDRFGEPLHSPHYQFNDGLISQVVRIFSSLVGAAPPPS
ncbi:N(2)-acetyl-L-2,4-diaminobutanoate deacetylase DoeB2 [Gilvimarinus sp. F26214L]|uniref:N(2)-acetyl-L-2,4-diaminobutanoate deacetylase DoeB2 n=1 Tax=Gilvimarinus sp. DZF01 TaxID=3461371 RepID=UPI0040455829